MTESDVISPVEEMVRSLSTIVIDADLSVIIPCDVDNNVNATVSFASDTLSCVIDKLTSA